MYQVSDYLIKRLNFTDLLCLIVELDINHIKELTRSSKNQTKEVEVVTPDKVSQYF